MKTLSTPRSLGPVWVVAESYNGQIRALSLQLIGKARNLADQLATEVEAFLWGTDLAGLPQSLVAAGADRVYVSETPEWGVYAPELGAELLIRLARERQPEIVLIGSTALGRELAPLLAARWQTGLTAHCVDLTLDENRRLAQYVPFGGGLLTIRCPEKRPQMVTVAEGVFPLPAPDSNRNGEIIVLPAPDAPCRVETLAIVPAEAAGAQLETAAIVVAGGAGVGDLDGWNQVVDLAQTLQAALGSTRPAVDAGWTPLATMIGQSGKMIHPELYIGVGISGELQHTVGIVGAGTRIAINNDPAAPIFQQVDYGVVADCRELIPLLLEKIHQYREAAG